VFWFEIETIEQLYNWVCNFLQMNMQTDGHRDIAVDIYWYAHKGWGLASDKAMPECLNKNLR
jgi:hypothetical protein